MRGDAAGELDAGDGTWTEELRERYTDRIVARLARQIPNLSAIKARVVLSPADLERANVNLLHGDPYGGSLALDQNFLWRPFPASPGHATAVDRLWHIGASTPRAGARYRLGDVGRAAAPPTGAAQAGGQPSARARRPLTPRFSISQITTLPASFEEDLRAYREAGAEGIGIWEIKLREGEETALLAAFRERPARVDVRDPGGSVHRTPTDPGPDGRRTGRGLLRRPTASEAVRADRVVLLTEPGAREVVLGGLETIAAEARSLGLWSRPSPTAGSRASSGRSSTRWARRPR